MEPHSMRIIQTLDEHQGEITCTRWAPHGFQLTTSVPREGERTLYVASRRLYVASGDVDGTVLLWDVMNAQVVRALPERNGSVIQMEWLPHAPQYLVVLCSQGMLVLWDCVANVVVWRKKFQTEEEIVYFQLNPFDSRQATFASGSGWIYFTNEINARRAPDITHKYRINSTVPASSYASSTPTRAMKQIIYSPSKRDILYFVMHKEILIFDLTTNLSVGTLVTERGRSPFAQIQLRKDEPDLLFCLHENGGISAWRVHRPQSPYKYEVASMWDLQRFAKQNKKTSVSIFAIHEGTHAQPELAMFANDGTLWIWDYRQGMSKSSFCITGLLETISSPIMSLKVRSFVKSNGSYVLSHIVAVGTQSGTLQIINLKNNEVEREFAISKQPLRCVRWLNQHTLITFSTEELAGGDSGCWKNHLFVVDIRNGRCTPIRDDKGIEVTFIRNIKVSYSRRYFALLLRDRPFELWDAQKLTFVRSVKPPADQQVSTFAWSPQIRKHTEGTMPPTFPNSERFVVATLPGHFHHFSVQNTSVSKLFSYVEPELATVTAMAWKGNYVVSGDAEGNIAVWEYDTRKSKVFATNSKVVRSIRFAPSSKSHQVLVLFKDGEFCIYDVEQCSRISNSSYLRNRQIRAIEGGWMDEFHPVLATSDGCLRVLDRTFVTCNSPFDFAFQEEVQTLHNPLHNIHVLPHKQQLYLRFLLQHNYLSALSTFPSARSSSDDQSLRLPSKWMNRLEAASSIPQRCLVVAEYFGDEEATEFWTLVLHAIQAISSDIALLQSPREELESTKEPTVELLSFTEDSETESTSPSVPAPSPVPSPSMLSPVPVQASLLDVSAEESQDTSEQASEQEEEPSTDGDTGTVSIPPIHILPPLPSYFDIYRPSQAVREEMVRDTMRRRKARPTLEHTKQNIDAFLRLRMSEEAIELLLETSPEDHRYLQDALMACVVAAASESKETFESIVQTVASNLLAQNQLRMGIQLLLLIKRGQEACSHLQKRGLWDEAAVLAKLQLPREEAEVVYLRWVNELLRQNRHQQAIALLVSLNKFADVLHVLRECGRCDASVLLCMALEEVGLLDQLPERSERLRVGASLTTKLLKEALFMDYGIYLLETGFHTRIATLLEENPSPPECAQLLCHSITKVNSIFTQ